MWLPLLLLIIAPDVVESNCHDHRYGAPSKSCKRIKDAKFQIRGVKIVPMWEFILLKESNSVKRVKRSGDRNATLPAANGYYSGGVNQRQFQPYPQNRGPLPVQRNPQSYSRTHDASMPAHHNTLIQGVDAHAPLPVQRHVIQRQVQPSILQSTLFSANIGQQYRKSKRQENYQTSQGYNTYPPPTTAPPYTAPPYTAAPYTAPPYTAPPYTAAPYTPSPYTLLPPGPPPLAPAGLSPAYSPGPYTNGQSQSGQQQPNEQEKGEGKKKSKGKKKKNKKKKNKKNKEKQSKMCKMCEELSAEDSSEEREVACEICEKASKKKKHGSKKLKEKEKGLLQSALKVKPIHGSKQEEDDEEDEEEEEEKEERKKGKGRGKGKGKEKDEEEEEEEDEHEEEEVEGEGGQVHEEGDEEYTEDEDESEKGPSTTTPKPTTTVSQPTILDYAERAKQNKLMRIPVYRGKKLGATNEYEKNATDPDAEKKREEEAASEFSSNIRNGTKMTKYSDKPNVKYSYPPKDTLPLQTCFHNPSGYVCCNLELNNIVESTYKEIKELPNFNPCNLQVIANKVQRASEKMFEHPFESIVSHADFAQNINFAGDLVCKLEIDGKYMIAYGTPYHADDALGPQGPDGKPLPVRSLKRF